MTEVLTPDIYRAHWLRAVGSGIKVKVHTGAQHLSVYTCRYIDEFRCSECYISNVSHHTKLFCWYYPATGEIILHKNDAHPTESYYTAFSSPSSKKYLVSHCNKEPDVSIYLKRLDQPSR